MGNSKWPNVNLFFKYLEKSLKLVNVTGLTVVGILLTDKITSLPICFGNSVVLCYDCTVSSNSGGVGIYCKGVFAKVEFSNVSRCDGWKTRRHDETEK